MFARVVVAWDGSDLAREAFACALAIGQAVTADLAVVRVLEGSGADDRDARSALDEAVGLALQAGVQCAASIERGVAREVIPSIARPTDLIAVGLIGLSGARGPGSTATAVARGARCPALVVGAPARRPRRVIAASDPQRPWPAAIDLARALARDAGWALELPDLDAQQGDEADADPIARALAAASRHDEAPILVAGAPVGVGIVDAMLRTGRSAARWARPPVLLVPDAE